MSVALVPNTAARQSTDGDLQSLVITGFDYCTKEGMAHRVSDIRDKEFNFSKIKDFVLRQAGIQLLCIAYERERSLRSDGPASPSGLTLDASEFAVCRPKTLVSSPTGTSNHFRASRVFYNEKNRLCDANGNEYRLNFRKEWYQSSRRRGRASRADGEYTYIYS